MDEQQFNTLQQLSLANEQHTVHHLSQAAVKNFLKVLTKHHATAVFTK